METLEDLHVESLIGSGSNAVVLRVRAGRKGRSAKQQSGETSEQQRLPSRPLALKVMSHFWDDNAKKLLDCERYVLAHIPPHPSVIRVLREFSAAIPENWSHQEFLSRDMAAAVGRDHVTQYFVMELHPATLDSWRFVWPSPMPYHLLWRLSLDLLTVMVHLQAHGVCHLDLKLDNVLLGFDGRAVLTDFGISRVFGPGTSMSMTYKEPFGVLMNRLVLSPEVLQGYDRAKDVWRKNKLSTKKQQQVSDARISRGSNAISNATPPAVPGRTPVDAATTAPDPRELTVPFAAQGVWAVGAILYELATGYGHEPCYPEDGGGMRDGWANAAGWPPMPVVAEKTSLSNSESPEHSARHISSAGTMVQLQDGSYRRFIESGTTHPSQGYPTLFSGLITSMLSSDPNTRVNAEDALTVLKACAPIYAPQCAAAAVARSNSNPESLPSSSFVLLDGSLIPSTDFNSHVVVPILAAQANRRSKSKGAQLPADGSRTSPYAVQVTPRQDMVASAGPTHTMPVLLRHWTGRAKLINLSITARVGHALTAWSLKAPGAGVAMSIQCIESGVQGVASASDDPDIQQARLFLGGHELSARAVLGNLALRLATLAGEDRDEVQEVVQEEEAWSDGDASESEQNDPDDALFIVTTHTRSKLTRCLEAVGGVLVIDIAPNSAQASVLSGQVHLASMADVCASTALLTNGYKHTPACRLSPPTPLRVDADDVAKPQMAQPTGLYPSLHARVATDALYPDPIAVWSLPVLVADTSRKSKDASASPQKGANGRLILPDCTEAVQAAAAAQHRLSAEARFQLVLQWMRSYSGRVTMNIPLQSLWKEGVQSIGALPRETQIDMRAGVMYRCLLALTGLSNTALREPTCGFAFADCAKFATAALIWYPHRHEVVAAAAGLLRNVSCTEDLEIAREMVHVHGALRSLVLGYFAPWVSAGTADAIDEEMHMEGTSSSATHSILHLDKLWRSHGHSVMRHHGQDPRLAEDCVLAASNLMRFDEMQVPHELVPVNGMARLASDAVHQGKSASSSVQTVQESAVRLNKYILCVEGTLERYGKHAKSDANAVSISSGAVATAVARAGCMSAMSHALGLFGSDKSMVEGALHVMCSLLVQSSNRTAGICPVQLSAEAVVSVMARVEHAEDTTILGLGATVLRNLACVTLAPDESEPLPEPLPYDDVLAGTGHEDGKAVSATAGQDAPDFSPALAVTAAGAPAVLEEAMAHHPTVASIQENGRCALYNLLLLGSADARNLAESAAVAKAETGKLRALLADAQKRAEDALALADAAATAASDGSERGPSLLPGAGPALEGARRGAALLTGAYGDASARDTIYSTSSSILGTGLGDAMETAAAVHTKAAAPSPHDGQEQYADMTGGVVCTGSSSSASSPRAEREGASTTRSTTEAGRGGGVVPLSVDHEHVSVLIDVGAVTPSNAVPDWGSSHGPARAIPEGKATCGTGQVVSSGVTQAPEYPAYHHWACWSQYTVAFWVTACLLIVAVGAAVLGFLVF